MATTVILTPVPSGSPAPYIDVLVDTIDVGVSFVTVWRTVNGRAMRVRGLINVASGSAVTAQDFEAPDGVVSSYRVEQFDGAGAFVSYSSSSTATLNFPTSSIQPGLKSTWMHNPLDPSTAVEVLMLDSAAKELSRSNPVEMFRVPGRSVGVALSGGRRGLEQVVLDCLTASFSEADRFDAMFGGYDDDTSPVICVRTPPAMRLPATLFVAVGTPRQLPQNNRFGGETVRWGVIGDEAAPPAEAIIVALLDYADFTAFYATYAAFTAAYLDYTAATKDYSIAGTA